MDASCKGKTGADYDELLGTIAAVCAEGDPVAAADLYARGELRAASGLVR